jgi:hypothetical protein
MSDRSDSAIEDVLNAYDVYHEEHEEETRQAVEAGVRFDATFRQLIASVIRPYFEEVAHQLQSHGHCALVEEGSVSSPDPRVAGGSKITLAFLPKEREQSLRHQLELNDAPHLLLRCDKSKRVIELYQQPDPGFLGEGVASELTWRIEDITREHLHARVFPLIDEVLNPRNHPRVETH